MSGLVAWRSRPHNRFGPLMLLTGVAALAGSLVWAPGDGAAHTVGQALDVLPLVLIVHVFVTFPTGRLHGRLEKLIIGTGYLAAAGGQVVAMTLGGLTPHGLTIAVFLAESHIVLTTWPEHRLLLIDTLLCNPDMDADVAIDAIVQLLCPRGEVVRSRVPRRIADRPNEA